MLKKNIEFENNIDSLTEKEEGHINEGKNPRRFNDLEEVEKIFIKKRKQSKVDQLFS